MGWRAKNISINLPGGLGGVQLDLSEEAERAAWSLYVEFNTRIATKPMELGEGSVREALTSLHQLFDVTRRVLKEGGLDVARARKGRSSVGAIAMGFLNEVVRPNLVRWHTSLSAYEAATWQRLLDSGKPLPNHPALAGALVDETGWEGYKAFYAELIDLQVELRRYVDILGALAGVTASPDVKARPRGD